MPSEVNIPDSLQRARPSISRSCAVVVFLFTVVLLLGLVYFVFLRPREWRARLVTQIRVVEPDLLQYAVDVRAGRIKKDMNNALPLPVLPPGGPNIKRVILDPQGNIVFEVERSANWCVGFELRNGDASLNGTGIGKVTVEPLFGNWWLFDDFGP